MVSSLNINNGKSENNKSKSYNDHNNQAELQIEEKSALPLIISMEEISRDAYLLRHDHKSLAGDPLTSKATRIAKIKLNRKIFKSSSIKSGDEISIKVFDGLEYKAIIDQVLITGNFRAITGKIEKTELAYLNLSITENLLLASMDIVEVNMSYLLRYNHQSANYYLFAAPYDQVDKPTYY